MSKLDEVKTSAEWLKELREEVEILDPDGWDRKDYDLSFNKELINKREFEHRFMMSTVSMPSNLKSIWKL